MTHDHTLSATCCRVAGGFRAGIGFVLLSTPIWLASCASLSSVHEIRVALQATNARVAQTETRNAKLEHQLQTLQTRSTQLASKTAHLGAEEAKLAAATQTAGAEAQTAIRQSRQTEENLLASLTRSVHPTLASREGGQYRWLFTRLIAQARKLAQEPYNPPPSAPPALRHIRRPLYQLLSFQGPLPLWSPNARLSIRFKPAGFLFDRTAGMHLVEEKRIVPLTFTPGDFRIPPPLARELPSRIGAAGFEVVDHSSRNRQTYAFLSFLGGGYFRAIGRDQWWGPLARSLAIDTAVPNQPGEFPAFRSFWIVVPARGDPTLTLFALLDGSSVTGAYRFRVTPGVTTSIQVAAALFLRHPVRRLGIAPLVSMFLRGRMDPLRQPTLHPAVHDSDGLSFETASGRWVWSPLVDPKHLNIRMFPLSDPQGFGLMQRDRHFNAYQSLVAHYQESPSVWVQPDGTWGAGQLALVEIPTNRPINDNIMAFWIPSRPPSPGHPLMLRYTIRWDEGRRTPAALGRVTATREVQSAHGFRTFTVYFRSERLKRIPAWIGLQPTVMVHGRGSVRNVSLAKLTGTARWRLRFTAPNRPGLTFQAWIHYRNKPLTEVWTYQIPR